MYNNIVVKALESYKVIKPMNNNNNVIPSGYVPNLIILFCFYKQKF